MCTQLDFFHGNIYNSAFSDKKNANFKNFVHMGFCGPKVSILNKVSQMLDFCPNNSIPTIFYKNNHFDINLIASKT